MTERFEEAVAKVRKLPRDRQDEAAELLMSVYGEGPGTLRLTPEQAAEVERRLASPPEYATHEAVRAFFQQKATA